jgi:hypothetical protein
MPQGRFEPTFLAGERPQTYALHRANAGTGIYAIVFDVFDILLTAYQATGPSPTPQPQ